MPRTLYLIDGYAQIFRAYYAIRGGMRSPVTGEPTQAVFGFTAMLLKLLTLEPDFVAVALDMPERTFRDDLYSDYKGTRQAAPDDLTAQIPRIVEVLEGFGIPVIGQPGLEADDVIASIVRQVREDPAAADVRIRMVSKDKDLEQLLDDQVTLYDVHTDSTLDVAGLRASKGISPEQVVDYLSLTGDTVDNVPGVAGIGPKTATQLLQQWGSLDGIYENLDQITGKRRECLEQARAHLPLTRTLVTLKRDAEVPFSLERAQVGPVDAGRLIPLFQQLGFGRFQGEARRLAGPAGAEASAAPAPEAAPVELIAGDYRLATEAEVQALAQTLRAQPLISVHAVPGPTPRCGPSGIALAWEPGCSVYVPLTAPDGEGETTADPVLALLAPALEDASLPKCGHHLKSTVRLLLRHGVRLRGAVFDSSLAAALIDPAQPTHDLKHLCQTLLGCCLSSAEEAAAPERAAVCAGEQADAALRLYHHLTPRLEAMGLAPLLREVEAPLAAVVAEMEEAGIGCDPHELKRQGEALAMRVEELRQQVHTVAGCEFHIDSTRQLAEVLFDRLGLTPGRRTKTGRSTDAEVLDKLAAEEDPADPRTSVPRLVIEYRHLSKLINTYLGSLQEAVDPRTGRIHSTFHQMYTSTGRLASQAPNLQTIPIRSDVGRQIRKAFPAPPGHVLLCADYSQIELRLLAHLSEDPALLDAFALDQDIHSAVAAQVYGTTPESVTREQRAHAKTINFGIIYGISAFGLARRIEGLDLTAARALIVEHQQRFPGIGAFLHRCVCHAVEHGYVTTLLGRRRAIPEVTSGNRTVRALGERLAINSVIQGSGADLIKRAMVNIQHRIDRERLPLRLLLQIHDELVFETPLEHAEEHALLVREEMERAMTLRVPLKAEAGTGPDWMSAK